jgi:hypothetical protein
VCVRTVLRAAEFSEFSGRKHLLGVGNTAYRVYYLQLNFTSVQTVKADPVATIGWTSVGLEQNFAQIIIHQLHSDLMGKFSDSMKLIK